MSQKIVCYGLAVLVAGQVACSSEGKGESTEAEPVLELLEEEALYNEEPVSNETKTEKKMESEQDMTSPFDGIYAHDASTPGIFIIQNHQVQVYNRKYDEAYPSNYYYDFDYTIDFEVKDGAFSCYEYEPTFEKENGVVVGMKDKYRTFVKAKSIGDIIQKHSMDARLLVAGMVSDGVDEGEAKGLITRNDLWEHLAIDPEKVIKFSLKDLALNYKDGGISQVETVSDIGAYDGVYGDKESTRLSRFLLVRNGTFRWYRLTTDSGEKPHELEFKYVSNVSSEDPVEISEGKYSYNRDREYGTFFVNGGEVTGLKAGTIEIIRMKTMGDILENNKRNIDARALLNELVTNHGFSQEGARKIIMETPLIDYFNTETKDNFQIIELLEKARNF